MSLSVDALTRCGVPAAKAVAHLPHISAAMREHEITTPLRARMFLAQVMHESAALRYFEEIASGTAYEGRRDLGNVRPGDGRRFKGRGPIQLVGRDNYKLFGRLLGVDLVRHPELAATPRVGWRITALYFERRGCNVAADRRDFAAVTRLISGSLQGYADRLRYYRLLSGVPVVPGEPYLGRGDAGDAVVTMTRRLSFVRSKETGKAYLDGKRNRFDAEAEAALRAFQADHRLNVDGRYGPRTARRLARATALEKRHRASAPEGEPVPVPAYPSRTPETTAASSPSVTSEQLLASLDRLDERGDRLRAALIERRGVLERALERIDDVRTHVGLVIDAPASDARRVLERAEADIAMVQQAVRVDLPAPESAAVASVASPATGGPSLSEITERLTALEAGQHRVRALLTKRLEELERAFALEPADRGGLTGDAATVADRGTRLGEVVAALATAGLSLVVRFSPRASQRPERRDAAGSSTGRERPFPSRDRETPA